MSTSTAATIPKAFVLRRLHSLTGLWFVLFLMGHLFTNSQAALWIGDDGKGFIHAVNGIHELPYLKAIELLFLAFPILIHTLWGIKYALTAHYNSFGPKGNHPHLPQYERNHAYTWQRLTAWLLVFLVAAHVIQMRFIDYPDVNTTAVHGQQQVTYSVKVTQDQGLEQLAARLGVILRDPPLSDQTAPAINARWAEAQDFGTAELLMVRETFKNPVMIVLYTLLVLTACFHGFNGLWTFMNKWGVTLTARSQLLMWRLAALLMLFFGGLGLSAVWLTYWVNLY